jgi:hypothetical protein
VTGELPASDPGPITERAHEQRVNSTFFLKDIQHLFGSFIQKGDRIDLNADDGFA